MSASQSQLSTAPSSSGVRKKSSKKKKKSRPGAHGSRQRRAPMDGGGVKSVQLSEEDLSASAASKCALNAPRQRSGRFCGGRAGS